MRPSRASQGGAKTSEVKARKPAPTSDAYRRLRDKADAHMTAERTEDAIETLRTIQRHQHLSQIK